MITARRAAAPGPGREDRPARVSFPPGTWVVMGLFALLLLGSLVGQLSLIKQQRDIGRDQRALAAIQLHQIEPLLDTARPLSAQTLKGLPRARAIAARADRLTRSATPLVQDLKDAGLPRQVRTVGTLTDALLMTGAPMSLAALGDLAASLGERDRLTRVVRSAITVLGTVRRTGLVGRAARATTVVDRLDRTQARALSILEQTLAIQRQALRLNRRTLTQATAAAEHAASLDRKLGGQLPATALGGR